jgi:hypothetical protein
VLCLLLRGQLVLQLLDAAPRLRERRLYPGRDGPARMTAPKARAADGDGGRVGGRGGTVRAEWTKLCTVPGTAWLLAATIMVTVAVSTAATAATRCPAGTGCPVDTTKLSLTGVQFGQAVVAAALLAGGLLMRLRDA